MNHIRAAATPVRRRQSIIGGNLSTPENRENDGMPAVGGNAVTPMKRVPILANFEEWMKMATDNVGELRLQNGSGRLTCGRKSTRRIRGILR